MRRWIILAGVMLLHPALAGADEVFLKGGGRVSGRITARTETSITVDVGAGTITVPMASVVRIDEQRTPLHEYEDRAARIRPDDLAGWLQLGRWAANEGLRTQARRGFERVLMLDPENVEANQALGRVRFQGRWVTEFESYRARGLVQFEGEWMTPAERDAILRDRDATLAELARLDAEQRARAAEARAAEAEARARAAEYAASQYRVGIPLWWSTWGPGVTWPARPGYKPGRYPPATWPASGMYPSSPMGTWPSYPIGAWPSYPIGARPSFPIGPSPPPAAVPPAPRGGHGRGGAAPPPSRRR